MINWYQNFVSCNSVCNHTRVSTNRTPSTWSSDFVNHSYDYRLLPFYTQYLVVPTRKAILYSKSAYLICDSPWERQSFVPLQKSRQITVLMYEQKPYQV